MLVLCSNEGLEATSSSVKYNFVTHCNRRFKRTCATLDVTSLAKMSQMQHGSRLVTFGVSPLWQQSTHITTPIKISALPLFVSF